MKNSKGSSLRSITLRMAIPVALMIGSRIEAAGMQVLEAASTPRRPNIVLILIDDMGYGDIPSFGSSNCVTPALDRMTSEGLKLTSFYAAPVCSATRASIQTGCYAPRVAIADVLPPGACVGLNPNEHTVAGLLKAQGYSTMCIGKWHLGDQPEFLPRNYGFDHYFGLPYSNDMLRPEASDGQPVIPLMRDDQVVGLWREDDQDQMTQLYTEAAVDFIKENRNHRFFLYLGHNAVHFPIHPGPAFRGKSGHGGYYDWVEEVDWSVGRVLDTLRELGLDKDTLVFFTSDNGPWLSKGKDAGTALPLYGGKGSTWEGGMRVPTIVWWPGQIAAGKVSDAVCGVIDLLPTFVALAGGTVPTDRTIDGANMSDLLVGTSNESPREAQYYFKNYELQAVRTGPWKLALRPQNYSMFVDTGGVKEPGLRLYNLVTDIGETTDVAAVYPEVVTQLKQLADRKAATLCDGSPDGPGVRPPGYSQSPRFLYPVTSEVQERADKFNARMKNLLRKHVPDQPKRVLSQPSTQGLLPHG